MGWTRLFVCLDRHIAHIIEPGLTVDEAIVGSQSVVALLGGHAVELAARGVAEAAAVHIEARERVERGHAVFHEAAVGRRVDAERRQRDDDLRAGLAVLAAPADKAAGGQLRRREDIQRLVDRRADVLVRVIVGRERLHGHGGHVGVGRRAGEGPAAVFERGVEDGLHQLLARHVAGGRIVVAVKRDERPDGAVDALILDELHAVEPAEQVVPADVGDILADGGEGEDDAGVLGGARVVETAVFVDVGP